MTEPNSEPKSAAAAPAPAPSLAKNASAKPTDNQEWVSVVVDDFEDAGITYYVDKNNIVYDTEDIYFGIKPARIIGRRVDGMFVPMKSNTSASPVSTSSTTSTT